MRTRKRRSKRAPDNWLDIDIDKVPGFDSFLRLFFQLQGFESADQSFDPRRSNNILKDFKELISESDYNSVVRDFKTQAKLLLKEVLN